ncbi:MAG: ribosomal protein S18-alanine N-acetyltransferase [Clostridia bacterium]|nr:ribosomal protein S18-alanine N-acetyltransferase [Clostridia bacterium]MDD4375437.1 ribosomal protein S18-alanine N-acetyltransferase [Clostridia bacterium]
MNNNLKISFANINNIHDIIIIQERLPIFTEKQLVNVLNDENRIILIAYSDNIPVAFICFAVLVDHIDIINIVTREAYKKQGIASRLINELYKFGSSKNINKFFLEVRITNTAAILLYEKNGFKKISTRKKYYTNPVEDALIYEYINI